MLDDYLKDQPTAYHFFKNSVKKNRCAHAYLIEANGYHNKNSLARAFAKYLFCPFHYTNSDNCKDCNQCKKIDDGNFLELEIISPDGMWIKKGQLEALQKEFSKKSLMGNKKVYIIEEADKLNGSSANSILKFLEEPEEGIFAILIVDNIYQVLPTIRSRCQIIRLAKTKQQENLENIMEEEISKVFEFMNYYEKHGMQTLTKINKLWFSHFKEKEKMRLGLEILLLFYKDLLNCQMNLPCENYPSYKESLEKLVGKNSINVLCNKINCIFEQKEKLKVNANANLLMDKLLICLERSKDI